MALRNALDMIPTVRELSPETCTMLQQQICRKWPIRSDAGLYPRERAGNIRLEIRAMRTREHAVIADFADMETFTAALPMLTENMRAYRAGKKRKLA